MKQPNQTKTNDTEVLSVDVLRKKYEYQPLVKPTIKEKLRKKFYCSTDTLYNFVPILKWLPAYNFKDNIFGDLVGGFTVTVMHISQGLAYAPLAGQTPVVGLYMAVFPCIIYLLLGSSRHLSIGTFAVVSVMVGKLVLTHATSDISYNNTIVSNVTGREYSPLEVGVAACFYTGAIQLILGILHIGNLWVLLSNSLVSGFTTGAAVHVIMHQVSNILGIKVGRFHGPLNLIYIVIDILKKIPETNFVSLGISSCSILILSVFNDHIKPLIKEKLPILKVPVPIELIVIVIGTMISYFTDIKTKYGVSIVGDIPSGIPSPVIPSFELFSSIVVDCFIIAVVAISVNLSLSLIFAKKSGYEISSNQELIAYGAANLFASFFQCVPSAASLSRSSVLHSVGGKTLLSYIVSIPTMLLILMYIGPFFEPVPYAVLSSIVVVTLKSLLWQVKDFPTFWKLSKLDGMVWLFSIISVIILDLDYGLAVGVAASIISLVLRGQYVQVILLGNIPKTTLLVNADEFNNLDKSDNVLVLKIEGSLHFANVSILNDKIHYYYNNFLKRSSEPSEKSMMTSVTIVLDFCCVPNADPKAVNTLLSIYEALNCEIYICGCNSNVYSLLDICNFFDTFPRQKVLCSTSDALLLLNSLQT